MGHAGVWRRRGGVVSKAYVETSDFLLADLDEMIREGLYRDRTEAVNDALCILIKQYKLSKLHAKDIVRRTRQSSAAE